jgi:hypothetical protein
MQKYLFSVITLKPTRKQKLQLIQEVIAVKKRKQNVFFELKLRWSQIYFLLLT